MYMNLVYEVRTNVCTHKYTYHVINTVNKDNYQKVSPMLRCAANDMTR